MNAQNAQQVPPSKLMMEGGELELSKTINMGSHTRDTVAIEDMQDTSTINAKE